MAPVRPALPPAPPMPALGPILPGRSEASFAARFVAFAIIYIMTDWSVIIKRHMMSFGKPPPRRRHSLRCAKLCYVGDDSDLRQINSCPTESHALANRDGRREPIAPSTSLRNHRHQYR